jgi:hypothetical protein
VVDSGCLSVVSFSVFSAPSDLRLSSWGCMEVPGKPKEAAHARAQAAAGAQSTPLCFGCLQCSCILNMFESNESTSERKQTTVNINKRL